MKSGLLISGSAHGLLLSIVLVNGVFLLSKSPDLSAKNVDIYLITQAEFDAEVSTPPSVSLDQNVNDEELFDPLNENVLTNYYLMFITYYLLLTSYFLLLTTY